MVIIIVLVLFSTQYGKKQSGHERKKSLAIARANRAPGVATPGRSDRILLAMMSHMLLEGGREPMKQKR